MNLNERCFFFIFFLGSIMSKKGKQEPIYPQLLIMFRDTLQQRHSLAQEKLWKAITSDAAEKRKQDDLEKASQHEVGVPSKKKGR